MRGAGLARSAAKWGLRGVGLVAAMLLAYVVAAAVGALVQTADASGGAGSAGESVRIYVATNGFHTDIVAPVVNPAKDWRDLLAASPFTRNRIAGARWIAFGWGSEVAYTRLGKLTDLTPAIMVKALAFDRSVVHVVPLGEIRSAPGVRLVQISGPGYRRLVKAIEESFALDAAKRPMLLDGVTHGYGDSFFRGQGRFSLFRGCNVWAGDALRTAGIRAGVWTPFAQSLMWANGLAGG